MLSNYEGFYKSQNILREVPRNRTIKIKSFQKRLYTDLKCVFEKSNKKSSAAFLVEEMQFFLPSLVRLGEWCSFVSSPHPPCPTPTSNYKLILNSSARQSTISHSFVAHRFDNFNMHDLELPLKTTQKFQVLSRWHAGHLPKVPNHMDVISLSLFILPGNLLAYESISQPRKPKGVRSQFSLKLPTLSDNIRVINITQDSQTL